MGEPSIGGPEGAEFSIQVTIDDGVGVLSWAGATNDETLQKAVSLAADDAIIGHGVRRLEVAVQVGDDMARRALHRAGFRLEGTRRAAVKVRDGEYVDVVMYSRLTTDLAAGPEGFTATMNSVLPRKRAMAHVLFRDESGRLLFCKQTYKDDWELPGGILEVGESPAEGAAREVAEELGLSLTPTRLLCLDWLPPYLGWEDALGFVFDGGVLSAGQIAALTPDEHEISMLQWCDVETACRHLIDGAAARLRAIAPLLDDPTAGPLYLQGGHPFGS